MFKRFASCVSGAVAIGSVNTISFWDEQRRVNEWKKNNPGKEYEMYHHAVAGTMGYYDPIEKKSMDQQTSRPRMK